MTTHAPTTSRRGLLAGLALAPAALGIAGLEARLPSLWNDRKAAWDRALKADRLYDAVHLSGDLDNVSDAVWDEAARLTEAEGDAWDALLLTPAPDLRAVSVKLDILFSAERRGKDDHIDSWHSKYTDSIRADVERLAAGGFN